MKCNIKGWIKEQAIKAGKTAVVYIIVLASVFLTLLASNIIMELIRRIK